ncbi:CDP-glycerol:poly(glycerophosphate) glycerophosphotransferase [[Clostridium] sordellii]|uniref:CDP-glycerol glycerophosphotransferase family protein n=1 Tax=Paraclostridium sordellii TaxID=1505 RepID=UPI0005DF8FBD|nr:CDP-glycerol glycerophosphotransferase family protein [Paeniclostridium sordellii]CEP46516.1 CDP-glycerol:poly(glycerophosphate) glycerophosphotransferase [[Clostridium] sordellii] [Paeniclostridium sordellii]
MRLNRKNNILKLIQTINEGLDYAKCKGGVESQSMLLDCFEALMYINSKITGENDDTQKIINEIICKTKETVNLIDNGNKFKESIDTIKEMIFRLSDSIINKIETQIEVVFMPYKVSMWDCMESVWKEAKNDPNCNCYVVPIPYYELDSQENVIKECYEGNMFSKEIDIIPHDLYDLENRQPDIIYIHNPYDELNRLTRIDARYFSSNLSKYTNMLVYIPYFVSGSYFDEADQSHFSNSPGALNATKVIVQSDIDKKLYVANGHKPDKILSLGSPKFDATIASLEKSFEETKKWDELIKNKKVILLNTGLTNLLDYGEKWVEDMEMVLDTFSKYDSCFLIWRPHPLTTVTIKNMRQDIIGLFNKFLAKIEDAKNIVIDLNSDAYPSISVSDALISDYSSIMLQYMATEKPILGMLGEEYIKEDNIYSLDYLGNYFTNRGTSIEDFIDMVINDKDPKKEERMSRLKSSTNNIDGKCGRIVYKTIKEEAISEILMCEKRG